MALSSEPPSLHFDEGLPPVCSDEGVSSSTGEETSASTCQHCASRALPALRLPGASTSGGTPAPASAAPATPQGQAPSMNKHLPPTQDCNTASMMPQAESEPSSHKEGASPSVPDAPDAPPSTNQDKCLRALTLMMPIENSGSTNQDEDLARVGGDNTASPASALMSKGRQILCKLGILKRPSVSIEADFILLVVGQMGSGRSTFINALLPVGERRMRVEENGSLSACTTEVQYSVINLMGSRIALVDTPGFNNLDRDKPDPKVLEEILAWLKTSFSAGAKYRGGVIYLHDLTNVRCPPIANEWPFVKTLCGLWNQQLVVVTTKWKYLAGEEEGQMRHSSFNEHWAKTLRPGTKIEPCKKVDDAWGIVQSFLPTLESNEVDVGKQAAEIARGSPQKTPFLKRIRK